MAGSPCVEETWSNTLDVTGGVLKAFTKLAKKVCLSSGTRYISNAAEANENDAFKIDTGLLADQGVYVPRRLSYNAVSNPGWISVSTPAIPSVVIIAPGAASQIIPGTEAIATIQNRGCTKMNVNGFFLFNAEVNPNGPIDWRFTAQSQIELNGAVQVAYPASPSQGWGNAYVRGNLTNFSSFGPLGVPFSSVINPGDELLLKTRVASVRTAGSSGGTIQNLISQIFHILMTPTE